MFSTVFLLLFSAENEVDIQDCDIRDQVRDGNELVIDFHVDLVSKNHGHMAIMGAMIHILKGTKCLMHNHNQTFIVRNVRWWLRQ